LAGDAVAALGESMSDKLQTEFEHHVSTLHADFSTRLGKTTCNTCGVEIESVVRVGISILSASVITGRGADQVALNTDLPCPFTIEGEPSQSKLSLYFSASAGTGVEYVRKHFLIEPEVIDLARERIKFSVERL
jgi:hypothetical protein